MNIDLIMFNEKQFETVKLNGEALFILSGYGLEKIQVLTHRITYIINNTINKRSKILGLNFTNKTVGVIRTHLDTLLKTGKDRVVLTSFHSFSTDILRQHGHHIGLRPDFIVLFEQADREAVATEAMKMLSKDVADTISGAAEALPLIDKMLAECSNPVALAERLGAHPRKEFLSQLFNAYRAELIKGNYLDFTSIIAMAVQLLEERPAIAKQFRRVYPYMCVYDLQNTNEIQFRLLCSLISSDKPNLFVVINDQLILQCSGTNYKQFLELLKIV